MVKGFPAYVHLKGLAIVLLKKSMKALILALRSAFEFSFLGEIAALDELSGQYGEPGLDLIEPGGMPWCLDHIIGGEAYDKTENIIGFLKDFYGADYRCRKILGQPLIIGLNKKRYFVSRQEKTQKNTASNVRVRSL